MSPPLTASSMASQLGSRAWSFTLGSPRSTSCSQTQSTEFSVVSGAELPLPVMLSDEESTHDQLEEEEENMELTEAFVTTAAVTAVDIVAPVSGDKSAVPSAPAELTMGNGSMRPPRPQMPSTVAAESAAPAAVVVTADVDPSHAFSPSPPKNPDEKSLAVNVGVALGLTSCAAGANFQRGPRSTLTSMNAPQQQQLQPPRQSPPPPTPTPRETNEIHTSNKVWLSRFSSTVDAGETSVPRCRAEKEGQDVRSAPMSTSDHCMKHILGEATVAATAPAPVTATASTEIKMEDIWPEQSPTPETITTSLMKSIGVGSSTVAEAKEETRRNTRSPFGLENMSANAARSRAGPRNASIGTSLLGGLGPRRATASPVLAAPAVLPAKRGQEVRTAVAYHSKATTGLVGGDEAIRARDTTTGTRGDSVSHLSTEEQGAGGQTQTEVEAADELWESIMQEEAREEVGAKRATTSNVKLANMVSQR